MICVDSSVVVKWLVPEELSDQARALRRAMLARAEPMVAPVLLAMEVNNVILQRTRGSNAISDAEASDLLTHFLSAEVELYDPVALHRNAFTIATTFRLPAIYDAYFLALAADAECPFWTADMKLVNTLDGRLPYVRWLGHFRI